MAPMGSPDPTGSSPGRRARLAPTALALLPIALITLIGASLRVTQLDQSLYGDELWGYVGATGSGLGDVLDFVRSDQEITPPLFTILAWLSAKIGDPTVMIRLPSLVAGVALIPLIYALAFRSLGRSVALTAAALAALSPFLAFYAVEARAYSLAVALAAGSTLAMLIAIERGGARWWIAYGALSCAAMYTHYTCVYVLVAQLAWLFVLRPEARRPAVIANVFAAVAYLPWLPSVLDDFGSPAQGNIGALVPFGPGQVLDFTAATAFGHPSDGLASFLGTVPEAALIAGMLLAVAGAVATTIRPAAGDAFPSTAEPLLFAMLALAAPVGVAAVSIVGDDQFLPRNLVTSWPGWAIAVALLLNAGPRPVRVAAIALVVGAFAYGAIETTRSAWQRPASKEAAHFIDANAEPGDVVVDLVTPAGTPLQPVSQTLDVNFERPHASVDPAQPDDGPDAVREAAGHRLVLAGNETLVGAAAEGLSLGEPELEASFPGNLPTTVRFYEVPTSGARP